MLPLSLSLPRANPASQRYPWYVLATVCLATFMGALDTGVINASYPSLAAAFDAPFSVIGWVGIAYLTTVVTLLTIFGRLSDILGYRPVFLSGYAVFLAGALLAGTSQSIGWLIAGRVLSGVGGAMLFANSVALVGAAFPASRRGTAVGVIEIVVAAAMAVGPMLGGVLTEQVGWRAIFFLNWPGGLLGLLLGLIVLREPPRRAERESFDLPGAVLFGSGMVSLLLALTGGSRYGWDSPPILAGFALAVVLLGTFLFVERRVRHPMIALSLFVSRAFSGAVLAKVCCYVAMLTALFLAPFYFQRALGFVPSQIGLALTPVPIALSISSLIMGPLSDRVGPRFIAPGGLLLAALGCLLLASASPASGYPAVFLGLLVLIFGLGTFISPNESVAMNAAPRDRLGVAGGLLAMARSMGMIFGVALASSLLNWQIGVYGAAGLDETSAFVAAFQDVFKVAAALALLGAGASALSVVHSARLLPEPSG